MFSRTTFVLATLAPNTPGPSASAERAILKCQILVDGQVVK